MNVKEKFKKFDLKALYPKKELYNAAKIFLSWMLPGMFSIVLMNSIESYLSIIYLKDAVDEAISPILWNVMGVIGMILFSGAMMFPSFLQLSKISNKVLENTYAMGSLMFGLLLGQIITETSSVTLEYWQWWAFGLTFIVLFISFFLINFALWYLSFLIGTGNEKSLFLIEIQKLGLPMQFCISLILLAIPLILLLIER